MDNSNIIEMRQKLLEWFKGNARALPWRTPSPRNPYWVATSEIMLQQTQVTSVLRYFDRWMEKFPDWKALAEAPIEAVLKTWEGMGYYTRARNLKKLAEAVVARGGELPRSARALEDLPGLGRYSSRSIASIAFGLPEACVDGNIVRVLARLHAIDKPYKSSSAAQHDFQPIAEEFLNKENPGEHNEALMELGATICTKLAPKCLLCPLREGCTAYKRGIMEKLPMLESVKVESRLVKRVWVINEGKILLQQGGTSFGNLEGLWELPTPEAVGITRLPRKEILRRVRAITKYKITEAIYRVTEIDGILTRTLGKENLRWVKPDELTTVPLSGPHAQWIQELLGRKK